MDERQKTAKAVEKVEAMFAFYVHASVFALVNAGLLAVNLVYGPEELWAPWVIFGWGLGVLLHAVLVFGRTPAFINRWQLRKIREVRAGL